MPPRRPSRLTSSADLDAAIARTAPDVLALLGDGVPRTEAAIVAALADRHPKDDVKRTIARLAVLEQLVEKGGRYILPAAEAELISSASSASRSVRRQSRKT
jgi:hypothetical protein